MPRHEISETVDDVMRDYRTAGCAVELIAVIEGRYQRMTVLKVYGGEAPVHTTIYEPIDPDPMDFPRPMSCGDYTRRATIEDAAEMMPDERAAFVREHGPFLRDMPGPLGNSLRRAP